MDVVSMLSNQLQEILGAWLRAIGSSISAISVTPTRLSGSTQANLNIVGLALQAAGSGIETEGQSTPFTLEYTGTAITTIGILENLTASLIDFPDKTDTILHIQGNLLKAVGSSLVVLDEIQDSTGVGALEGIIGNMLQTIGSVIQVIAFNLQYTNSQLSEDDNQQQADSYMQRNQQNGNQGQKEGQNLMTLGAWIQAIGAVIAAIGQQKEETQELQLGIDE